ncbi:MAG: ABC transporter permease, partial [Synechococcaceae cyanobacterium]|nr:ABC transporter permease [Synechococcaceae cyanobacterium]
MVGRRARLGLLAAGGAGLLALAVGLVRRATPPPPPPVVERPVRTVTALGRLEPVSALRTIAAPATGAGQPTLQALL